MSPDNPAKSVRTKVDYRPYAMRYLSMWLDTERACCEAVQRPDLMDESTRIKHVRRAAAYFVVARNLPGAAACKSAADHYRPLLAVVDQFEWPQHPLGYVEAVNQFQSLVQATYGIRHRVRSLATKFLWLKFQERVVILDSQARIALGLREDVDLQEYEKAWRRRYRDARSAISEACDDLGTVLRFASNPHQVPMDELERTIQACWFRERVFDVALWFRPRN